MSEPAENNEEGHPEKKELDGYLVGAVFCNTVGSLEVLLEYDRSNEVDDGDDGIC